MSLKIMEAATDRIERTSPAVDCVRCQSPGSRSLDAVPTTGRRLKVLISAYACDPDSGSEPGMGWHWIRNLAQYHDLWVLTEQNRFAPALIEALRGNPGLGDRVHVVPVWRHRFGEKLWSHLYYLTYRQWQIDAYRVAGGLHQRIRFDLVHQLNMIGYREPGFLWKLDVPFLWGPIGGHAQMPWPFVWSLDSGGVIHYSLRNILNAVQMRASHRVRRAAGRASALFAATPDDRTALWKIHRRESLLVPELGATPTLRAWPKDQESVPTRRSLRLVWCGKLIERKALPLGLRALRRVLDLGIAARLDIVGDGPCFSAWKRTTEQLGLSEYCTWHGDQAHERALALVASGDALLFTSVQDATATVVLEALQSGVPVICHDACGFGAIIDSSCGIKVPFQNPGVSIEGFANAIAELARSAASRQRLSQGALERARAMTWQLKAAEMAGVYQEVAGSKPR